MGRHTGELTGRDLVNTTRKFELEKKVSIKGFVVSIYFLFFMQLGWMVGDGASVNDVAVRTVCEILDPAQKRLRPKQVRVL